MILGCGAIGHQVARQLATMGVGMMDLWDFDTIEPANLGTQGWTHDSCGEHKTDELSRIVRNLNPECRVLTNASRWTARDGVPAEVTALFVCVDSLPARQDVSILGEPNTSPPYHLLDTRMGARAMRIVCPATFQAYKDSLPREDQIYEAPCTERATFFCASIAAGLAVSAFVEMLRGNPPVLRDYLFNLVALDIAESEPFDPPPKET